MSLQAAPLVSSSPAAKAEASAKLAEASAQQAKASLQEAKTSLRDATKSSDEAATVAVSSTDKTVTSKAELAKTVKGEAVEAEAEAVEAEAKAAAAAAKARKKAAAAATAATAGNQQQAIRKAEKAHYAAAEAAKAEKVAKAAAKKADQAAEDAKEAAEEAAAAAQQAAQQAASNVTAVAPAVSNVTAVAPAVAPAVSPQQQAAQQAASNASAAAVPPAADKFSFTKSWESNKWYNIGVSNDADVKTIIDNQAIMTTDNLKSRPVTGAILSFDSDVVYFDYADFKKEKIEPGASDDAKKASLTLELGTSRAQTNNIPVVSLLSEKGTTFLGICFSKCSSSDIDGPYMGNLSDVKDRATATMGRVSGRVSKFFGRVSSNSQTTPEEKSPEEKRLEKDTRLICGKNQNSGTGVKILFFPGHSLYYIFFEGNVTFDNDGKFTGLKEGTLLRKVKGNGNTNAYEVLKGTFQGTTVTPGTGNKFLQYDYTAAKPLSTTGYAAGNVGWNFQDPFPLANMTKPGVTFLNWNMDSRETKEYIDGEDEFKCDSMHYTLYGNGFSAASLDSLFDDAVAVSAAAAAATGTSITPVDASARKMEFIKKENFSDPSTTPTKNNYGLQHEILTLYKLKCKVAGDVVCIIEYIKSNKPNDSFSNRVRLYITRGEKTQKTRIKNGLFIRFKPEANGYFKIKDENFVGFYEINEKGEQTGITYNRAKSKKTLSGATVYEIIKNSKIQQLNEKCKSFDSDNKKLVDINVKAAAASYNLFLDDTNGLIATLIKTHETNKNTAIYTEKDVMDGLVTEFNAMKSTVQKVLTQALIDVKTIEQSESYVDKMENGFNSLFPPQASLAAPAAPQTSAPVSAPAAPQAASTLTITQPTLTTNLNSASFNLITDAGITSPSPSTLTFTSSNDSVAEVNTKGDVSLKKVGKVNITVSDVINTENVTLDVQPASAAPAPAAPLKLEAGCIAQYKHANSTTYKVFVTSIDNLNSMANIMNQVGVKRWKQADILAVRFSELIVIQSKDAVDKAMKANSSKTKQNVIFDLLTGGKGKRRRSTRKYQKRRGRGNGNNGRRRLTRKVKGQSGGGGGARRGGKIHRKTKKRGRGGRGGRRGRRGHRRTIKKYHSI